MRKILIALLLFTTPAAAQVRLPGGRVPPAPALTGIDALRVEFGTQSGGTTVYFGAGSS